MGRFCPALRVTTRMSRCRPHSEQHSADCGSSSRGSSISGARSATASLSLTETKELPRLVSAGEAGDRNLGYLLGRQGRRVSDGVSPTRAPRAFRRRATVAATWRPPSRRPLGGGCRQRRGCGRRGVGSGLAAEELEHRGVGFLGMGPADVVRAVLDFDDREVGDQVLVSDLSRAAVAWKGRIRSAVPWTTSVGTSILGRSPRKSVSHVSTHA